MKTIVRCSIQRAWTIFTRFFRLCFVAGDWRRMWRLPVLLAFTVGELKVQKSIKPNATITANLNICKFPSLKMWNLSRHVHFSWLRNWRVNWFLRCQFRRVCIIASRTKVMRYICCSEYAAKYKRECVHTVKFAQRFTIWNSLAKQNPRLRSFMKRNDDVWVAGMHQMFQFNSCSSFGSVKAYTLSHSTRTSLEL